MHNVSKQGSIRTIRSMEPVEICAWALIALQDLCSEALLTQTRQNRKVLREGDPGEERHFQGRSVKLEERFIFAKCSLFHLECTTYCHSTVVIVSTDSLFF